MSYAVGPPPALAWPPLYPGADAGRASQPPPAQAAHTSGASPEGHRRVRTQGKPRPPRGGPPQLRWPGSGQGTENARTASPEGSVQNQEMDWE